MPKLHFTIWRAFSRNGKLKNIHIFTCRISYERVTILEFLKMTLPGSMDPSSLAYCIYMKVIFQGLIKIREGIYKNAKNPQEPLY